MTVYYILYILYYYYIQESLLGIENLKIYYQYTQNIEYRKQ